MDSSSRCHWALPPSESVLSNKPRHHSLSASEQREFQNVIERRQMKDFMQMYSKLVQRFLLPRTLLSTNTTITAEAAWGAQGSVIIYGRCFDDCVNDFTSKAVSSKEETCIGRCVDKFIKASERTGQRFAEQNQAMVQGGGPGIGGR
ncbi:hypothetical protein P167DRAFT_545744 [Morchella conica CCBAS932]|uniref:Mitochondrial import inner membrane translocase subunit n=1 Tax=Morchella conica CCBAS932 TaxID=1392247 RepID=A0A3N4KRU0_9PEZI|nr:hypothetical protein P167DRAFT_545744 [Morchella conica CCBAS932]